MILVGLSLYNCETISTDATDSTIVADAIIATNLDSSTVTTGSTITDLDHSTFTTDWDNSTDNGKPSIFCSI